MNNFRISDSFDKFTEERKISITPVDEISITEGETRLTFNANAWFVSSPSGEQFHIDIIVCPNVILLDNVTRLHVSFEDRFYGLSRSISRKDLETICNSDVVEFSNDNQTRGLGELILIPLARTLYNTAIEQRYPQEEIDRLYIVYRDKIRSLQQSITKENRKEYFASTGIWLLFFVTLFFVVLGVIIYVIVEG